MIWNLIFLCEIPLPTVSGSRCSPSNPFNPFHDRSFAIATFNVNGLVTSPSVSFRELSNIFFINRLAFCGVVDTHLSHKLMKHHFSLLPNYSGFYSVIDPLASARSSDGVSLFLHSSFAVHVQSYTSHSSRLLTVDLYFKGSIKLRVFIVYIPTAQ